MDLYIGKKLFYMNKKYQVVFCEIIKIDKDDIVIKNENGIKLDIKLSWIKESNRIEPAYIEKKDQYLQCFCGSIRFNYDNVTKKIICKECCSEWEQSEISSLESTEYKSEEIEKIKLN